MERKGDNEGDGNDPESKRDGDDDCRDRKEDSCKEDGDAEEGKEREGQGDMHTGDPCEQTSYIYQWT